MSSITVHAFCLMCFFFLALLHMGHAQSMAPSPLADAPVSDAASIDQGIAYVLLLVALAITYLVH
ncbi:hypothetical protein AAC387_Pa03g3622 [Persea americana]